jgi:hypothetical protein
VAEPASQLDPRTICGTVTKSTKAFPLDLPTAAPPAEIVSTDPYQRDLKTGRSSLNEELTPAQGKTRGKRNKPFCVALRKEQTSVR